MTEEIEYEQFEQSASPQGGSREPAGEVDLRRVSEVPMELSVEIGRTHMTVGQTLELRAGSVVVLDRLAGDPVDLLVNGTPIARGEVVVVDDKFGLRLKEILEAHDGEHRDGLEGPAADGEGVAVALDGQPMTVEG